MNKYSWILWALILILPGAVGLGFHFAQKNAIDEKLSAAVKVTSENPTTEEYLQMYEAWSNLPPDEKLDNSWGQGKYGGPEIQKRLRENQIHQLWADMPDLDKGFKHYPEHLAEKLYGIGWQEQLEEYRNKNEMADMTLIGSVLILSSGGLIFLGGLIKVLVVMLLKKKDEQADSSQSEDSEAEETEPADTSIDDEVAEKTEIPAFTDADSRPVSDTEKLVMSKDDQTEAADASVDRDDKGYFGAKKVASHKDGDDPNPQKTRASGLSALTATLSSASISEKPAKDAYFGWAVDGDGNDDLDTMMTTEPLTKELTELSEEMSAIREFAAQQQDQVRKLQDGYDWMIVRRFCMRIIRCVDNIEDRRGRLEDEEGQVAMCLEDIRDELVFALESSGVEQFAPDLESPFKGLEKYAEAVRDRVKTDNAELVGTIAKIVRPGYQYLISEDDVKIVRCAQVQLYEANQNE